MNFKSRFSTRAHVLAAVLLAHMTACSSVSSTGADGLNPSTATFSPTPPKPGYGVVYVGRPMGFNTSVFAVPLELDGKPLASLGPNQYARVELSPGHHEIAATNNAWSRAINGVPHPAKLTVEAGKAYYLLPKIWAGESRMNIIMVNNMAIPTQSAVGHSSFTVQVSAPNAAPPAAFQKLSPATPES